MDELFKHVWIARNKCGTLELYSHRPIRKEDCFEEVEPSHWLAYLDDSYYPSVTWDNSPIELIL